MKIIMTTHTYAPNSDGVQFVTQYLAEGLVKLGHKVTVLTNLYPNRCKEEKSCINGVDIIRIKAKTIHTIHKGNKKDYINLVKQMCLNYDIMINVCTQCALTDWLLPIINTIEIPKILYLHSIWKFAYDKENFTSIKNLLGKVWGNLRWSLYYKLNGKNFKKYDKIIQLHKLDYSYKFFKKKYGIDSEIIENAAEENFFNDVIEKNVIVPKHYIINVSNYSKLKNQLNCLKIFLNSNMKDDWELILIGSRKNEYYEKIKKYYNEYIKLNPNGKKVQLLYSIPRENIATYVKQSSIYVMTSKKEGFPISLIESMASGVPFISSNVGIVRFLPGGIIANNNEEYKYWLEKLSNDKFLRNHYGKIAQCEAQKRYRINDKVKELEKILKSVIK